MIGEIVRWIWLGSHPESAILAWRMADKDWLFTLLVVAGMSSFFILVPHGVLSGIFWGLRQFFGINPFLKSPKRKGKRDRKKGWARTAKVNRRLFIRWLTRKVQAHPYQILFVFNLVPIPLLTYGTVVAAKVLNVRRGVLAILVGNWVKILLEIYIAFRI